MKRMERWKPLLFYAEGFPNKWKKTFYLLNIFHPKTYAKEFYLKKIEWGSLCHRYTKMKRVPFLIEYLLWIWLTTAKLNCAYLLHPYGKFVESATSKYIDKWSTLFPLGKIRIRLRKASQNKLSRSTIAKRINNAHCKVEERHYTICNHRPRKHQNKVSSY